MVAFKLFKLFHARPLASREVQNNFGQVTNTVLRGEGVVVTQYNKPTLMILLYEVGLEAMRLYRAEQMIHFMKSITTNDEAESLTLEDINRLVHELRPFCFYFHSNLTKAPQ
ncbi:putative Prevent-host-death family protein [Crenothrix polyspora]|uniref:Putative Prevent-host-death family protein n=1 Tax=Crenothrix polyspora TaxID=360316 RepID=A0A1R4HCV6_9GAMM|nr:putative Prevent-host-death family protein [Crenothrix polyspora]